MISKIFLCLLFIGLDGILGAPLTLNYEKVLTNLLREHYGRIGKIGRPVAKVNDTLTVNFGLTLLQIPDVDYRTQTISVTGYIAMQWEDVHLTWKPEDFGGLKKIHLPAEDIFVPDIAAYNNAAEPEFFIKDIIAVVQNDGNVFLVPSTKHTFACEIPHPSVHTEFNCTLRFGSWTYDGNMIDMAPSSKEVDVSSFTANPNYELVKSKVEKEVKHYACCSEPYIDLAYELTLKHKHAIPRKSVNGIY